MISATSSPCQPFPLLDCTICSSGTSNTVSWLLSSKGVCSIPCFPSCCQTDAADTGVVLHQRSANAFLRFYHRTSSSQKNCPRDTNRRSSPATPSVVHEMLSAAFLGLSVVNFVGGPNHSPTALAVLDLNFNNTHAPLPSLCIYYKPRCYLLLSRRALPNDMHQDNGSSTGHSGLQSLLRVRPCHCQNGVR